MKHMKIVAMALVLALLLPLFPATALAAEEVGFRVSVSTEDARPGELVEVTVSLTGYTAAAAEADAIRGLQVDLSGADPDVLKMVSCTSLIEDTSALTNTASYNEADARARLLYVQMDGTLAPCQDVFKAAFRVNPDLNHDGNITLPVTMKIQTVSRQIVLTGECTISFTATIFSVDLAWGNMEFTYNPGPQFPYLQGGHRSCRRLVLRRGCEPDHRDQPFQCTRNGNGGLYTDRHLCGKLAAGRCVGGHCR